MSFFGYIVVASMTSEGNSALLPANVDRRPSIQWGLMNFQPQNFQLYNRSLKDWSFGKQSILFNSGPVIKCLMFYRSVTSLPLRRFVFYTKAIAKRESCESLVTKRKGPREGQKWEARWRLARFLFPAFLCAQIFMERETSGYEAEYLQFQTAPVSASLLRAAISEVPVYLALS